MLYAKVVLGIPVEGPFDYIIPLLFSKRIKPGARVEVNFSGRKMLGFVVGLSKKSKIKNLKSISEAPDTSPVIDKNLLLLTKKLSEYYCCSWGEAIEAALPLKLRNPQVKTDIKPAAYPKPVNGESQVLLLHDLGFNSRQEVYLNAIKETLSVSRSAIVILPDIDSAVKFKEVIKDKLKVVPTLLFRKEVSEQDEWLKIKEGRSNIVVGSRSAVFAPLNNLGLLILDEEEETVYKQDQSPHYHARQVAFMRSRIDKARLILGSTSPSLESMYLVKKNTARYQFLPRKEKIPEIKIIDSAKLFDRDRTNKSALSGYIQDIITSSLALGEKILIFLNRTGFATFVSCQHCGRVLKCPRCSINLVYHFKDNILSCHYCNFKIPPPDICPECNHGYIRYSGSGIEKIESEVSRLFPQAKISQLDTKDEKTPIEADIFISTQHIIRINTKQRFDLIIVLSIDASLNRVDWRSSEKTFALLSGLMRLSDKRIVILTHNPGHHIFRSLKDNNVNLFYDEELRQRRQLKFPPYRHFSFVKLRGKSESKVRDAAEALFKNLTAANTNKSIKILSLNPGQPAKLRGNFYWQILISSVSAESVSSFLKICLKNFSHSGIIVTVDIDPL